MFDHMENNEVPEAPEENDPNKFWMIWREKGGQPIKRHTSFSSVETEANRLAKQFPGEKFYILEATHIVTVRFDVDVVKIGG